jgi:hypothetical protein
MLGIFAGPSMGQFWATHGPQSKTPTSRSALWFSQVVDLAEEFVVAGAGYETDLISRM